MPFILGKNQQENKNDTSNLEKVKLIDSRIAADKKRKPKTKRRKHAEALQDSNTDLIKKREEKTHETKKLKKFAKPFLDESLLNLRAQRDRANK